MQGEGEHTIAQKLATVGYKRLGCSLSDMDFNVRVGLCKANFGALIDLTRFGRTVAASPKNVKGSVAATERRIS